MDLKNLFQLFNLIALTLLSINHSVKSENQCICQINLSNTKETFRTLIDLSIQFGLRAFIFRSAIDCASAVCSSKLLFQLFHTSFSPGLQWNPNCQGVFTDWGNDAFLLLSRLQQFPLHAANAMRLTSGWAPHGLFGFKQKKSCKKRLTFMWDFTVHEKGKF